jgi:hypothetical protein
LSRGSRRHNPLALLESTTVHLHAGHLRALPAGTQALRGQRQLLITRRRLPTFFHAFFANPFRGPPDSLGKQLQLPNFGLRFRGIPETDSLRCGKHVPPIYARRVVLVGFKAKRGGLRGKKAAGI